MRYFITQSCCKDASCTAACPVNCIHPRLDDATFTGCIKRGPSGVIGNNNRCVRETMAHLLAEVAAGMVVPPPDQSGFRELLRQWQPNAIGFDGWRRIDAAERLAGQRAGQPRIKVTRAAAMLRAATQQGKYPPDRRGMNESTRGSCTHQ